MLLQISIKDRESRKFLDFLELMKESIVEKVEIIKPEEEKPDLRTELTEALEELKAEQTEATGRKITLAHG